MIDQSLPTRCPAGALGNVGFQPGFVKEANAFQHVRHEGLAVRDPDVPLSRHLGALLLKRLNVFFCASAQGAGKAARPSWGQHIRPAQRRAAPPSPRA